MDDSVNQIRQTLKFGSHGEHAPHRTVRGLLNGVVHLSFETAKSMTDTFGLERGSRIHGSRL
jgi:hypothetical protein